MIPYVRKKKIIEILKKNEVVYIKELHNILPTISESTLRRDIKFLVSQHLVMSLSGGAIKLISDNIDYSDLSNKNLNLDSKKKIAKAAADLVKEHETIFVDSGSTCLEIIFYLFNRELNVITSNVQVLEYVKMAKFNCIVLGGEIRKDVQSILGPLTDNMLFDLHFDRAFLGAKGFSITNGYSTPDFQEGSKKRLVLQKSTKKYMLLDDSKINKDFACKICGPDEAVLITNKNFDIFTRLDKYIISD